MTTSVLPVTYVHYKLTLTPPHTHPHTHARTGTCARVFMRAHVQGRARTCIGSFVSEP
jgi:hypothetical protein